MGIIKKWKSASPFKFLITEPGVLLPDVRCNPEEKELNRLITIHITLKTLWPCPTYWDSQCALEGGMQIPITWHTRWHFSSWSSPVCNRYLVEQGYKDSDYKWHPWIHQGHGWMILKVNYSVRPRKTDEYHFFPNVLWLLFAFFYWLFSVMDSSLLHL